MTRRFCILVLKLGLALAFSGQMLAGATAQPKDIPGTGAESPGVATMESGQLAKMLQTKDFFFVNVHIPYEGEIKGTDALIAFDEIAENLHKLPPDKNAKIVLYCRSGRMSETVAMELSRLGYARVSHLAGGMISWTKAGYDIIVE